MVANRSVLGLMMERGESVYLEIENLPFLGSMSKSLWDPGPGDCL